MGLSVGYESGQVEMMRRMLERGTAREGKPKCQPYSNCGKLVPLDKMILYNDTLFCEECYRELKVNKKDSQK